MRTTLLHKSEEFVQYARTESNADHGTNKGVAYNYLRAAETLEEEKNYHTDNNGDKDPIRQKFIESLGAKITLSYQRAYYSFLFVIDHEIEMHRHSNAEAFYEICIEVADKKLGFGISDLLHTMHKRIDEIDLVIKEADECRRYGEAETYLAKKETLRSYMKQITKDRYN